MRKQTVHGFRVPGAPDQEGKEEQKVDTWIWEGEDKELRKWMGQHGTVPENQSLLFDSSGNNVALADVKCPGTYFTLCRKKRKVPSCQGGLFVRRLLILSSMACGFRKARKVAKRCRHHGCLTTITIHFRGIYCLGLRPRGAEWNAGYVFKIECFQI